ncbi:ATP synthase subunit g, mitochondrial-like [Leptopilina boulardi]|uniref:ATP synthase subunit g, mitochondrial-like n=1 Tax=Leptopilina boulardi TaxID=63433 RepID=UPI0021F5244E|nr:ATP synthase subunit g, mitochondrial-like [Leptopilina boulardi]
MSKLAVKTSPLITSLLTAAKPKINTAVRYAKVELVPPKLSEIPQIAASVKKIIHSAKTGAYRELTIKEAWLNTLVCIEVYCWFFIGECIGKRHLPGYNV